MVANRCLALIWFMHQIWKFVNRSPRFIISFILWSVLKQIRVQLDSISNKNDIFWTILWCFSQNNKELSLEGRLADWIANQYYISQISIANVFFDSFLKHLKKYYDFWLEMKLISGGIWHGLGFGPKRGSSLNWFNATKNLCKKLSEISIFLVGRSDPPIFLILPLDYRIEQTNRVLNELCHHLIDYCDWKKYRI